MTRRILDVIIPPAALCWQRLTLGANKAMHDVEQAVMAAGNPRPRWWCTRYRPCPLCRRCRPR